MTVTENAPSKESQSIPYLMFNMQKILQLKDNYEYNLNHVRLELPRDCNWDSPLQVKTYFKNQFDITLENVKISHVLSHLESLDHDSPAFDVVNGYILLLRLKYSLKNYIDCIIRHNDNGRVNLRLFEGRWVLPNRQPISMNPEITECLITHKKE